jgi:hypothetical protein
VTDMVNSKSDFVKFVIATVRSVTDFERSVIQTVKSATDITQSVTDFTRSEPFLRQNELLWSAATGRGVLKRGHVRAFQDGPFI